METPKNKQGDGESVFICVIFVLSPGQNFDTNPVLSYEIKHLFLKSQIKSSLSCYLLDACFSTAPIISMKEDVMGFQKIPFKYKNEISDS